ncbi:MAG: response regulator [Salibacteraceae bacterium]
MNHNPYPTMIKVKTVVVCIVDDDDIYQYTATKAIKALGVVKKILVLSDGEQALEYLEHNILNPALLPDVIYLDINMPYLDGWGFMDEYAKKKPKLPKKITIYLVTSSVSPYDIERAKKISDISDYLVKPITMEDFKRTIEQTTQ